MATTAPRRLGAGGGAAARGGGAGDAGRGGMAIGAEETALADIGGSAAVPGAGALAPNPQDVHSGAAPAATSTTDAQRGQRRRGMPVEPAPVS
jgi:hypothetical protein